MWITLRQHLISVRRHRPGRPLRAVRSLPAAWKNGRPGDRIYRLGIAASAGTTNPAGNSTFCFQKRVVKDAEFFTFDDSGRVAENPDTRRGFAGVWNKDYFGWEYKGPDEDLDEAVFS